MPGENAPAAGDRERDAVEGERGRVVQQALALEDRDDWRGDGEPGGNGGGRDRIGRSDDCAKDERHRPRDAGNERVGHHGHGQGVAMTSPTARELIVPRFARKLRNGVKYAAI